MEEDEAKKASYENGLLYNYSFGIFHFYLQQQRKTPASLACVFFHQKVHCGYVANVQQDQQISLVLFEQCIQT